MPAYTGRRDPVPAGSVDPEDFDFDFDQAVHDAVDGTYETPAGAQAKADAKVAQTITNGVTTSAPSQDAVFDALALKMPTDISTLTASTSPDTDDEIVVWLDGALRRVPLSDVLALGGGGGGTVDVVSNVAADRILGRVTSGSGDSEELTAAQVKTLLALVKGDVGLGNVDNTSDANKPVSTATQTALDLKANAANPVFTGTVTIPDGALAIADTNGLQAALDAKAADADVVHDTGDETIAGVKTFSSAPVIPADVYDSSWNGLQEPAPKDAIWDALGAVSANGKSLVTAADYAAMKALLDLEIGVDVQAYDADLATWAGLTPSANAQSLVTAVNYAAMRTLLGLVIGTNVQAWDADLDTWAGKTAPSGTVVGTSDTQTLTNKTLEDTGAIEQNVNTVAASGATETLDVSLYGVHDVTMDQNCTFTFSNPAPSGDNSTFVLILRGAFTPTLPASVDWGDASAPTYTTPSVYVFTTVDGGTTWLGVQSGKAFG